MNIIKYRFGAAIVAIHCFSLATNATTTLMRDTLPVAALRSTLPPVDTAAPLTVANNTFVGVNNDTPQYRLDVNGLSTGNPLHLTGLLQGSSTDSLITSKDGVLRRLSMDSLSSSVQFMNSSTATMTKSGNTYVPQVVISPQVNNQLTNNGGLYVAPADYNNLANKPDLTPYATKNDIGRGAANIYYVSRLWTGERGGVSWTAQANAAKLGSNSFPFCDIWQARDSAVTHLRSGKIPTAVITVLDGSYSFAEDTAATKVVDYRIPVGVNAVKYYANWDSDTTSKRTSNLAFKNLFWFFGKNTYLKNWTASQSILFGEYGTVGVDNFGCEGLDYESLYGQGDGRLHQAGKNLGSSEIAISTSPNVRLHFEQYYPRRGHSNILTLAGKNSSFYAKRFYRPTGQMNLVPAWSDTSYIANNFFAGDYRIGERWSGDPLLFVNDIWNTWYLFGAINKIINFTVDNLYMDDGSDLLTVGHFSGTQVMKNCQLNFKFNNIVQQQPRETMTWNIPLITLSGSTKPNNSLNFLANTVRMQEILIGTAGQFDSFKITININNAQFDSKNLPSIKDKSPLSFGKGGSDYFVKVIGKYSCKNYASLISIPDGAGTYVFEGDFTTDDDKPVITVGAGFTGKIILNGKFINGKNVATPTTNCVSGTNANIVIQAALSNTPVASTITTLGNTLSVNAAFKY